MNKSGLLLSMLLLALSATTVFAAPIAQQQLAIPTVTRLVQTFTVLEQGVQEYTQQRNATGLAALLADDFEMRVGAMPGNPVPRAQWLQQVVQRPGSPADMQQMAVHDYDSVAVVSFLLKPDKSAKSPADIYMVDVWKKVGDKWLLAVRYASPAGSPHYPIPGLAVDMPQLDKRY